jgi:outer membrane protein OmpA-like peptidoglycan-associated protein
MGRGFAVANRLFKLWVMAALYCMAGIVSAEQQASERALPEDLLDLANGALVLSVTSQYDEVKWSGLTLIDGTTHAGWASEEGKIGENVIVLELPYEARLDSFVVNTNGIDGNGRGARHFTLLGSAASATEGFQPLLSGEAGDRARTPFKLDNAMPVRWLQFKIADNWGDPRYTEIMELEAYGTRTSPEKPLPPVSGVYATNYNLMRITQTGQSVEGCYDWDNGVLSGDTDGRVIRFEWREDGPQIGNAIMVLNDQADYLNGLWYEGGALRGIWYGPRVTDGREPECRTGASNVVADTLGAGAPATLYGIRFDLDSDRLRPDSDPTLNALLEALKGHPDWHIAIEGHTDSQGSDSYNLDLSTRRAQAVKNWLAEHGIDAARLRTSGKGESEPAADNATPQGRALNRRVVVRVVS